MGYTRAQILDLIQYAVEEGSGSPCGINDASTIYADWQHANNLTAA